MQYQATAQFDAIQGAPLNLAQTNVANVSGVALLPGVDLPLVEGKDYAVDVVAGTVTLLRKLDASHVFFWFEHSNTPPPIVTQPTRDEKLATAIAEIRKEMRDDPDLKSLDARTAKALDVIITKFGVAIGAGQ